MKYIGRSFVTRSLGPWNLHYVGHFTWARRYFLWIAQHVLQMKSTYLSWHRWINSSRYLFGKHSNNTMYESLPLALSFCWCLRWLNTHAHVTRPTFSDASMCTWTSERLNKHMHCILFIIVLDVTYKLKGHGVWNRVSRDTKETWGPNGQIVCLGNFEWKNV